MAAEPKPELENQASGPLASPVEVRDTTSEPEDDPESLPENQDGQDQPPPKRKGGRKPIYATVEERKQRNRQAQAAFRERRSEYIKQLESTLQQHEELLHLAQRDRQATAYHSSSMQKRINALEHILRDNGIDVESELRARGEQAALSLQPSGLSGLLPVASASGMRRPAKLPGTTGNTKLDMLKSKAASARNSIISPLNSPQSQAGAWNDTSPTSPNIPSPVGGQYGSTASALYAAGVPSLSDMHDYSRNDLVLSASHAEPHPLRSSTDTLPASYASRELPLPIDSIDGLHTSDEWRRRSQSDWSPIHGFFSDAARASKPPAYPRTNSSTIAHGTDRGPHHRRGPSLKRGSAVLNDHDLTMPEGFSQEIFPLTYASGRMQFPTHTSGQNRSGTQSTMP